MKKIIYSALILSSISFGYAQTKKSATKTATKQNSTKKSMELISEEDKASYGIGMNIAANLKAQGFEKLNVALVSKAMQDMMSNKKTDMTQEEAGESVQSYFAKLMAKKGEGASAEGQAFLEANKKQPGVVLLPSGLQYIVMVEGKGEKPKETSTVKTHYHGTTIDGKVFDSSVERGEPAEFPVNGVIKGWTEALQLMPVGSKWKLFIPSDLAYGERGAGQSIGPNTTLIFEVELLAITK